jgi:hypothetical protein
MRAKRGQNRDHQAPLGFLSLRPCFFISCDWTRDPCSDPKTELQSDVPPAPPQFKLPSPSSPRGNTGRRQGRTRGSPARQGLPSSPPCIIANDLGYGSRVTSGYGFGARPFTSISTSTSILLLALGASHFHMFPHPITTAARQIVTNTPDSQLEK